MNYTNTPTEQEGWDLLNKVIDQNSIGKNYILFSIYEFRVEQKDKGTINRKYFAIFNNFYTIKNENTLTK
ncbi:DUF4359 domain-containing protein [Cohnella soli]|uniref:DUF4359 domain-containing protein n=1 Tax=Cohnella soli TaxID=425005 RepID=A0ABW0HJW0_9BACL